MIRLKKLQSVCSQYNVDTNRLYTTGQSMGGMMSFYFNITHPDLFAASLFVSSQWDTSKMQDFGNKKFFYIVAGGDKKAYGGMQDLAKVLKDNDVRVDSASWSAKLPSQEQERLAEELIARGGNINFIKWESGSVLPETGRAMEHMASFDYGYKIQLSEIGFSSRARNKVLSCKQRQRHRVRHGWLNSVSDWMSRLSPSTQLQVTWESNKRRMITSD